MTNVCTLALFGALVRIASQRFAQEHRIGHGDRLVKVVLPNPGHIEQELVAIRIACRFIICNDIRVM